MNITFNAGMELTIVENGVSRTFNNKAEMDAYLLKMNITRAGQKFDEERLIKERSSWAIQKLMVENVIKESQDRCRSSGASLKKLQDKNYECENLRADAQNLKTAYGTNAIALKSAQANVEALKKKLEELKFTNAPED